MAQRREEIQGVYRLEEITRGTFAAEKVRRDALEQEDHGKSDIAELCGVV